MRYQSYQSGIETEEEELMEKMVVKLSIVPKWNWNFIVKAYGISEAAINRTKVELKRRRDKVNFLQAALSIVPKWNWN